MKMSKLLWLQTRKILFRRVDHKKCFNNLLMMRPIKTMTRVKYKEIRINQVLRWTLCNMKVEPVKDMVDIIQDRHHRGELLLEGRVHNNNGVRAEVFNHHMHLDIRIIIT